MKESVRKYLMGAGAGLLISLAGLFHIYSSEGMRFTAYPDPATGGAPWTICNGHTGPEVVPGLTVDSKQCAAWLHADTAAAEADLKGLVKVPVRQGEWDALVSFRFNLGRKALASSTLLRKLNAGDRKGSCYEYPKWKYANKMVMEGLVVRRTKEEAMCLTPGAYVYVPNP